MVCDIRDQCRLTHRYQQLRERGLLTFAEYTAAVGASEQTVKTCRRNGLIQGIAYSDKNGPPAPHELTKPKRTKARALPTQGPMWM
jgi:hypothetical protein